MQRYAVINKQVGETPLEAMEAWRRESGVTKDIPLAYAGRLDPMASGALIVLIGEECKRQKAYQQFDKEYHFEVLLGFSSDTGDILGMAERNPTNNRTISHDALVEAVATLKGTHTFRYPRFSSRTVRGIPLHEWTLSGGLPDSEVPTYAAHIKRARFHGVRTVSAAEVRTYVHERIGRIPPVTDPKKALGADFRRGTILPRWDTLLTDSTETFTIVEARAIVSSGTYIRTLAEEMGRTLGTSALAYSIHRTRIGRYHSLPFGFEWWFPTVANMD